MKTPLITNLVEEAEGFQQAAKAYPMIPPSPAEQALTAELEECKAALRQSEALFQATFDQAAVGMAHATLTGSWLRINRRFCEIVGYAVEELLLIPFDELTHPEERTKDRVAIRQLLAGDMPSYSTPKRYLHKAGHPIWTNLTLSLVRDPHGQPAYFVAVIEDIARLKQAEEGVQHREARDQPLAQQRQTHAVEEMRQFLQSTFDAFAASAAVLERNGTVTKVNAAWRRGGAPNGLTPPACIGQSYFTLCRTASGLPPAAADAAITGLHAVIAGEQPEFCMEYHGDHAQQTAWFEMHITPFAEAAPRRVVVTHTDITAYKQAEIAAQQQRQFAEALRDSLVALTSSHDVDTVMQQILASAVTVVPCEAGSIIRFEEDRGRVAHLRGYPSEAVTFFQNYAFSLDSLTVGAALVNNQAYLIADTQTAPNWTALPVTQWVRSSVGVPIERQGAVIGLLVLDSATPQHFQTTDIDKLQAFAHHASLALENALHTSRLEQHVVTRTAELQAAKEQVEAILNNSLDAILLIQADLSIKRANAVFCTLFACEIQGCQPHSLLTYIHEDDVAQVMLSVDTVIQRRIGQQFEVRARRHDGTIFDAEFSIGSIKDNELVLTLRDITERKARERQLRFYASLQENVSDAVVALDLNWQIQSWNQAAESIYGWRAAEVMGQNCAQLLQTRLSSGFPMEQIRRNLLEQGHFQGEVIQRRKDGREIYLLTSATLLKDDKGLSVGIVVVNHDISERKQVEEALMQYAAEVEDLYNNAPCGYYSLDQDGLIIQINDTALHWLGYQRQEIVGVCKVTALLTPASRDIFLANFPTFQQEGFMKDAEFELVRKDGSIMRFLLSSTAVYDEQGTYLRDRAAFYDITALKQAQEAIRESEARYRLLAENITDGIIRMNTHGECRYSSPSIYNILGYTPEELYGLSVFIFIHPDDLASMSVFSVDKIKPGQSMPVSIYRVRHKAGHYVWLESRSQAIFAEGSDTLLGFITTSRDITERKRAEDALLLKMEEERIFQNYLKTLHEITIELTQIDWLDDFYRRAVELGLERLGFERLGLLRYDAEFDLAIGTYGTDVQGNVVAEPYIRLQLGSYGGILQRSLASNERFCFDEYAPLYSNFELIGFGWNAMTVLRDGQQVLGWLGADNGRQHKPVSKPQLEILALYSLTLSTLLSRKLAVVALRENERKFRQLVKAAPIAIIISNDSGQITLVNDQAEALFGYTSTELLTQPVEMLVPAAVHTVHTVHRDTYVTAAAVGPVERTAELFANRKDGTLFPVEIELSHIETADGLMIMSFIMDISERKAAERALREQRDFLQLVIDTIPDFIAVKDQSGRFQLVNRRTAELYGVTPTALLGKREIDIHPDQRALERFQTQDQQALFSGQPLFIPEDTFGKYSYQINVIPLKNEVAAFDRLLVVGSDITQRKRAEEVLQQALQKEKELGELKSRFVSMASHEFRTPLTSIMVLTETLSSYRHKLTDEQIAQRLSKIQDQIGHLKTIMDDVLQLARIQARRMEFNPMPVDLDELCRSVVEEFQSQPTAAQRLRYTYAPTTSPLHLDKRLMRQIISNLLSNALKYSAIDKSVDLHLTYAEGAVVLQVRDEGIGIPPDDIKHLFQPFHRATNVGTISGTGLGLSITKESVELHGGTITVDSQVGVGTTFVVTLPATSSK